METLTDLNVLWDAGLRSISGSSWKSGPQLFELDILSRIVAIKDREESGELKLLKGSEFPLNERGHLRYIHGSVVDDRVLEHALNDYVLDAALKPYLYYYNGASQVGKGVDFTREAFEKDLHNYYLEHRDNKGWVGFMDFSKFYDNIRHDVTEQMILPKIDDFSGYVFESILDDFKIDVSYMTDEEYADCLDRKFNSLEYHDTIPDEWKTGEKYMRKSVNIGNHTSQNIGIYVPTPIDNYITCVMGFDKYHRYMDDLAMIHESREHIVRTMDGVRKEADRIGLYINEKKTRICRLEDTFTFLQRKYSLEDNGRVIKRIKQEGVTRERRRMKKYDHQIDLEHMSYEDVEQAIKSWMGAYVKVMSKKQIGNMKKLYAELFGKELTWKK